MTTQPYFVLKCMSVVPFVISLACLLHLCTNCDIYVKPDHKSGYREGDLLDVIPFSTSGLI